LARENTRTLPNLDVDPSAKGQDSPRERDSGQAGEGRVTARAEARNLDRN